MRPTASTMLQQNNNNNYPCLNVSGSAGEMLPKCSRASLPFPGRLELGLGDLPLIRGLRAWALCSKNRRKAGSLLGGGGGGGQAPTAPPVGRGASTSCPRPADVYLSQEWGRLGYGLPLGLDARQAGIGALVTVATLKTSEGSGKTQTQCLFLRTEKGNCLYSTAKPGSGVVGGWLRGKTGGGGGGGGGRGGGRKDNGPSPPAQTGANWVRVRSARRWRKSGHAASREKAESRERQQRSREDPAGESSVEERQEEPDKEGLDCKRFPSPQEDGRKSRCCHNASPKACSRCGRRAQGREAQDENDSGESPRRSNSNELNGDRKGMRKERQRNEEEEEEREEEGALCKPQSYCSFEAESSPDLQSSCTNRHSHMEESQGEAQRDKELQTSQKKDNYSDENEDTNPDGETLPTVNGDVIGGRSRLFTDDRADGERCEDVAANVNGICDYAKATLELESEPFNQEENGEIEDPTESLVFHCFASDCASESSVPTGGSTRPEPCRSQKEHESSQSHFEGRRQQQEGNSDIWKSECQEGNCAADNTVKEELDEPGKPPFISKNEEIGDRLEERADLFSPVRHKDPSISETDGGIEAGKSCGTRESESSEEPEITEERLNPERGGKTAPNWGRESSYNELDEAEQEDSYDRVKRDEAVGKEWRVQESEDADGEWREEEEGEEEEGDTCGPTSITNNEANGESSTDVSVDPPIPYSLPPDYPAPSLPPLEFMATSLDCLEAEKEQEEEEEEEEEESCETAGDKEGGQGGRRRELDEEGSTVATEEEKKEEEEDEFGVFMQAEEEPDWSEGFTTSASVPCGSRGSAALGDEAAGEESSHWTSGWTDGSFHQSEETWAAFPQDSSDDCGDAVEQWWPSSAVEEGRGGLSTNHNLAAIFVEAFPSLPPPSSSDSRDLKTVPTLTQLLRGRASQDQGLLDNFHDLNKMIGRRYKRASGVSRNLLLRTLQLEQPHIESRPALWTANRRLSPGLPSANQHAQNAAAKRRLSYDYNRNIME